MILQNKIQFKFIQSLKATEKMNSKILTNRKNLLIKRERNTQFHFGFSVVKNDFYKVNYYL